MVRHCHSFLPERPLELLLGGAGGGDVDGEEELLEVDVAVLVRVEGPEDVVAELLGVARGEEHLVHVDELDRGESAIRAVLFEPLVPLLDGVFVVTCVSLEELQVLLGQTLLGLDTTHAVSRKHYPLMLQLMHSLHSSPQLLLYTTLSVQLKAFTSRRRITSNFDLCPLTHFLLKAMD